MAVPPVVQSCTLLYWNHAVIVSSNPTPTYFKTIHMSPSGRRRSVDSSSSSDSDSKMHRDEKRHRDDKKHHQGEDNSRSLLDHFPHMPGLPAGGSQQHIESPSHAPPPYAPPAAGERLALNTTEAFPAHQAGPHPCIDADGSPVFLGSALFYSTGNTGGRPDSVHPCKIAPHLSPPCRVPYGGGEFEHHGRYDLLPFVPQMMEWVLTSRGQIPQGRRPIEGGVENHGAKLYHAVAKVGNVWVPGKTGAHLVCSAPYTARLVDLCAHVFYRVVVT